MEFLTAEGCNIVVKGADMCGVLPDSLGKGEGGAFKAACKELLSDMMTVKPEFIHRWPKDSNVISFLH